jgi:hypothetical protein
MVIWLYFFDAGTKVLVQKAVINYWNDKGDIREGESVLIMMNLPWLLKPLYGIIVDCLPIAGSSRKNYLILGSLV